MGKRTGLRWNINECLRLQREFELLKLSLHEIAELHGRSVQAIMYKVHSEGLADYSSLILAYQHDSQEDYFYQKDSDDLDVQCDDVSELHNESDDIGYDPYDFAKNLMELQQQVTSLANKYMSNFDKKNSYSSTCI